MMKSLLTICSVVLLTACAQVRIIPLNPDGTKREGAQEGVRYYLPKPYLLVTEVPVDQSGETLAIQKSDNGDAEGNGSTEAKGRGSGAAPNKGNKTDNGSKNGAGGGSSTAPSPTTDTSFGMFTKQYGIKLIYLPDFAQPMAITAQTGFGTASMKPSLQDGWMLTSLDATGDSKTAENIGAIASLISSIKGAGGSSAAGSSKSSATGSKDQVNMLEEDGNGVSDATNAPILPPGLYELVYDDKGKLSGLKHVSYFCNSGLAQNPCTVDETKKAKGEKKKDAK